MTQSEQINELVAALAKAQLEYSPVHKDTINPFYASRYAELGTIIAATQKALANNALVVTQWPCVNNEHQEAGVITELAHSSGQWKRMELMLPAVGKERGGGSKYDAQTIGSAITYARRYAYQAIVGIAAETDDDANSISAEASGSKEAAKAVADRKIAEHKAKAANGNVEDATVILDGIGDGLMALSGKGLSVVKSEMKDDDRKFFNIRSHNGKWTMLEKLVPEFVSLCRRFNVETIFMDAPSQRGPMAPEKASVPPFTAPGKSNSTDPILMDCVRVEKEGKKAFLEVQWNGRKHSCFDKGMWPTLETAKGLPVMLEVKANGRYSNIVRVLSVDGIDFTEHQEQTEAGAAESAS